MAVELVEMNCDQNLMDCLAEEAKLSGPAEQTIGFQVRSRLIRMYGRMKDDSCFLAEVDAKLAEAAAKKKPAPAASTAGAAPAISQGSATSV